MKGKKLTKDQKRRIKKLKERKDALVWQFIGAMNEINAQIDEIRCESTSEPNMKDISSACSIGKYDDVGRYLVNEITFEEEGDE